MKLVDDARRAWRWISVQMMVLAGALQAAWVAMPDDLRASVPPQLLPWITFALLVLGICGRLVDQSRPPPDSSTSQSPPPSGRSP